MTTVQPDLFGEYDAAQERAAERARIAPLWRAWLNAGPRPAPWATQGGLEQGEMTDDWWRCPGCGELGFGAYSFWLSHGFHPEYVGDVPWAWEDHGGCHRTIRWRLTGGPGPLGVPGSRPWLEASS